MTGWILQCLKQKKTRSSTEKTTCRRRTKCTKDEVTGTGDQGCIDDKRMCFSTWDDTECAWQSRPFKGRQVRRRKGKKEKARDDPKGPEEYSLAMNRYKITNGGQKRFLFGGPNERTARKPCQKAMMVFRRVVFALTSPTQVQARTFSKTKAEERIKKEKAKKEPFFNPDFQPLKNPMKKDMAMPGNRTIGLPVFGLTIPGLQMLDGSAQGMDGGNFIESSNTFCSGLWLHTVHWIEISNRKIQETCMVLWHYDGILPFQ